MTGVQMLMKQVGLDPDKVLQTYNQITTQLPQFLNALGAKVNEIEKRLAAIETGQRLIMKELHLESPTESDSRELERTITTNGTGNQRSN